MAVVSMATDGTLANYTYKSVMENFGLIYNLKSMMIYNKNIFNKSNCRGHVITMHKSQYILQVY